VEEEKIEPVSGLLERYAEDEEKEAESRLD
jgi:hypothetical protein